MIEFGTGGWRAIIAEDFTFYNVKRVGKALAAYIRENDYREKMVVGHDFRFLSGRFSRALAESLADEGIEVLFMDEAAPTPMVMLAVDEEGLDLGASVTASHNPPEYNGIKVFVEGGRDAPEDVTDRLEEIVQGMDDFAYTRGHFFDLIEKGKISYYNNKNEYIDSLLEQVDQDIIREKNFKILFNPMFGVARDIMMMCLSTLRCYVDTINDYRDTMFGLDMPAPEQGSLGDMEFQLEKNDYDLGIATDGDSDRMALLDESGRYVSPNKILTLLYYYLQEYRDESGGVVRNVATTHVLDRMAEHYGEQAVEVPVGFKHIVRAMDEEDLLLGGESSGGLKLRGHINGKDGILSAMLAVEMIARTGLKIGELLEEIRHKFGSFKFFAGNYEYSQDERQKLREKFFAEKHVPNFDRELECVSYKDGVKYNFKDSTWLSIRFSGTEPLLRVYMEMKSREGIGEILEVLARDDRLALEDFDKLKEQIR